MFKIELNLSTMNVKLCLAVTTQHLNFLSLLVFSWPISVDSGVYALVFPTLLYPLNNISICCSIGLTMAISIER